MGPQGVHFALCHHGALLCLSTKLTYQTIWWSFAFVPHFPALFDTNSTYWYLSPQPPSTFLYDVPTGDGQSSAEGTGGPLPSSRCPLPPLPLWSQSSLSFRSPLPMPHAFWNGYVGTVFLGELATLQSSILPIPANATVLFYFLSPYKKQHTVPS